MDCMLSWNTKELELVGAILIGEVGRWVSHAAFVFVVEKPVYRCTRPRGVTECKLKMFSPLVTALGLKIFSV